MKWWNNGTINKRSNLSPGVGFSHGRISFNRIRPTETTIRKISNSLKGKPAWNKGMSTGPESTETKLRKSIAAKNRDNSPYKGIAPWNKGKSSNTDIRIAGYASKQRGRKRAGKYKKGIDHHGWNPDLKRFKRYRYEVLSITEKIYETHHRIINPNNYTRTLARVSGGYHLDHIKSIKYGFINNYPPEDIASLSNLQMMPWKDNVRKGWK